MQVLWFVHVMVIVQYCLWYFHSFRDICYKKCIHTVSTYKIKKDTNACLVSWTTLIKLCIVDTLISEKATVISSDNEDGADMVPRRHTKELPPQGFRKKDALHLPLKDDLPNAARCRKPGCNMKTRHLCSHCNVYLCLELSKNCFLEFLA